jgi:hypothetical protein
MNYSQTAPVEAINQTINSLATNGITAILVDTKEEAKAKLLEMIPKGTAVMTMSSVSLDQAGIAAAINEGSDYVSLKNQLWSMSRETQGREMQTLGAAPEYVVGSAQAVTQDGSLIFASNTGSQLPAYAYGSDHMYLVIGANKIVPTLDDGMKRLYDYTLPLESERAHKAYGVPSSFVSKLLIMHRETKPERVTVILVKEALGY